MKFDGHVRRVNGPLLMPPKPLLGENFQTMDSVSV